MATVKTEGQNAIAAAQQTTFTWLPVQHQTQMRKQLHVLIPSVGYVLLLLYLHYSLMFILSMRAWSVHKRL